MSRFNCNDCCLNNTSACRFGASKSKDYSESCPDLLVEQNVAYEKALDDVLKEIKPCVICSSYPNDCEDRRHYEICVTENSKTYKNLKQTIERLKKGKEE